MQGLYPIYKPRKNKENRRMKDIRQVRVIEPTEVVYKQLIDRGKGFKDQQRRFPIEISLWRK